MWRLYTNDKGLEIYEFVIKDENRSIVICFNNFTKEEEKSVYQLMKKMRENIENEWKETKKIFRSDYFDKESDENYKKSYQRNAFLQLRSVGWRLP